MHKTYIIAEGPDGVYFIDQHTAHERIRYEELVTQRERGDVPSQRLLVPVPISLTDRQSEQLGEHGDALARLGFALSPIDPHNCLLESVPQVVGSDRDARLALLEVLEAFDRAEPAPGVDPALATLACHGAVRAGDALDPSEVRALLTRLESLDILHYCPHGRPIVIRLESSQLARDFGR